MQAFNWKTESVTDIHPDEFYTLIAKNREHLRRTFPVTLSGCATPEKTKDFIANAIAKQKNRDGYYFYLRDPESNLLIGYVSIKNINRHSFKCELAYFVDSDFQGRGIISHAVADTVAFCFSELDMNKVYICTSKVNNASQQVAIKNGFIQEGILREEFKNGDGALEDIVYFGLLKKDFNER